MIKHATEDDIPRMLEMGERFWKASPLKQWVTYDRYSFAKTLRKMLSSPKAHIVVEYRGGQAVGMAAVVVLQHWLDQNHRVGHELFWWTDPEHRGNGQKLHEMIETWAKGQGAQTLEMGSLAGLRENALDRYYRRKGFDLMDNIYCKSLV